MSNIKIYILITSILFSACSTKNITTNNDKNRTLSLTEVESLETSIITGAVIGKVTGIDIAATTIVGSAIGLGVGKELLEMQLNYLEKENYLINEISKSIKNQKQLSTDINSLKTKISHLNDEIKSIKSINKTIKDKKKLAEKINIKKNKIVELKELNNSAIDDVLAYKNLLSYTKYPKDKKKEIEKVLDSVLTELFSLREKCKINLDKLNDLQKRIT